MMRIFCPAFCSNLPVQGRSRWPRAKGSSSCTAMRLTACSGSPVLPLWASKAPTSKGVNTMPSKVEADALQTAAGILPRAMLVSAMADCTVAGKAHKNSMPCTKGGGSNRAHSGWASQPTRGNTMNVVAVTTRCRRQWPIPAQMAWRESLLPCKKKSKTITQVVALFKISANIPVAGARLAIVTVESRSRVKVSGLKRTKILENQADWKNSLTFYRSCR